MLNNDHKISKNNIKYQKLIIAGSRTIDNYNILIEALTAAVNAKAIVNTFHTEIVSGGAMGVDTLASQYAYNHGLKFTEMAPIYRHNNDRTAPLRRNADMAKYGDVLVAIWDGMSTGTKHMINQMNKLGKPVYVYMVKNQDLCN